MNSSIVVRTYKRIEIYSSRPPQQFTRTNPTCLTWEEVSAFCFNDILRRNNIVGEGDASLEKKSKKTFCVGFALIPNRFTPFYGNPRTYDFDDVIPYTPSCRNNDAIDVSEKRRENKREPIPSQIRFGTRVRRGVILRVITRHSLCIVLVRAFLRLVFFFFYWRLHAHATDIDIAPNILSLSLKISKAKIGVAIET